MISFLGRSGPEAPKPTIDSPRCSPSYTSPVVAHHTILQQDWATSPRQRGSSRRFKVALGKKAWKEHMVCGLARKAFRGHLCCSHLSGRRGVRWSRSALCNSTRHFIMLIHARYEYAEWTRWVDIGSSSLHPTSAGCHSRKPIDSRLVSKANDPRRMT